MQAPAPMLSPYEVGTAPFLEEKGLSGQEGTEHRPQLHGDLNPHPSRLKDILHFVSSLDLRCVGVH